MTRPGAAADPARAGTRYQAVTVAALAVATVGRQEPAMRHALVSAALLALLAGPAAAETLVVHEWGTFTSFQDEAGRAIGRINVDDEPVPAFVHDAAPGYLSALNDHAPFLQKCWPAGVPR